MATLVYFRPFTIEDLADLLQVDSAGSGRTYLQSGFADRRDVVGIGRSGPLRCPSLVGSIPNLSPRVWDKVPEVDPFAAIWPDTVASVGRLAGWLAGWLCELSVPFPENEPTACSVWFWGTYENPVNPTGLHIQVYKTVIRETLEPSLVKVSLSIYVRLPRKLPWTPARPTGTCMLAAVVAGAGPGAARGIVPVSELRSTVEMALGQAVPLDCIQEAKIVL